MESMHDEMIDHDIEVSEPKSFVSPEEAGELSSGGGLSDSEKLEEIRLAVLHGTSMYHRLDVHEYERIINKIREIISGDNASFYTKGYTK